MDETLTSDLPSCFKTKDRAMLLDEIHPTQCGLRNVEQVDAMVDFVRKGGFFSQESLDNYGGYNALMSIRKFEDGKLFLHDGHHRALSIWLAGRDFIRDDEFEITTWEYNDYTSPNPSAGFFTPFHPMNEVRHAEFHSFKEEIRKIAENDVEKAMSFIEENRNRYCQTRNCWHIKDITP